LVAKFDRDGGTRLTTGVGMVVIGLLDLDHALAQWLRVMLIAVARPCLSAVAGCPGGCGRSADGQMITTLNIVIVALAAFGALILVGLIVGSIVSRSRRWWD
jgi:hypothetical protein